MFKSLSEQSLRGSGLSCRENTLYVLSTYRRSNNLFMCLSFAIHCSPIDIRFPTMFETLEGGSLAYLCFCFFGTGMPGDVRVAVLCLLVPMGGPTGGTQQENWNQTRRRQRSDEIRYHVILLLHLAASKRIYDCLCECSAHDHCHRSCNPLYGVLAA